jgi:hypothetical protein
MNPSCSIQRLEYFNVYNAGVSGYIEKREPIAAGGMEIYLVNRKIPGCLYGWSGQLIILVRCTFRKGWYYLFDSYKRMSMGEEHS